MHPPATDGPGLFCAALATRLGVDEATTSTPGVTIAPDESRAGSRVASLYVLNRRTIIWCDPAVADLAVGYDLADADPQRWLSWAAANGANHVGDGAFHVLPAAMEPTPATTVRSDANDRDRIARFLEQCDDEEIDDADIDADALDPVVQIVTTGDDLAISAFASACPWEDLPEWWDIGVLTHPAHRRQGLGARCVRDVIAGIQGQGGRALYRHNAVNVASRAVAESLGFELACTVSAIQWPEPDAAS